MNAYSAVLQRYSAGARERQDSLCCPVEYEAGLLALLPDEIIAKDYGCGDPSRYVRRGDVVLDLGCGAGKICYIAAQQVGPEGQVIGIDMNDDMLALARKYQSEMADKLGGDRVRFVKGYIQDLALDLAAQEGYLRDHPVRSHTDLLALEAWTAQQKRERPLIADHSVDLVVSNCVLNLVDDAQKTALAHEILRVLKPGGRIAISDIVSDEPVPETLKSDPELWSGCISGAFQEQAFLQAFIDAGFIAVAYDKWETEPWRTIEGIEFRSVTLTAVKPSAEPCLDYGHAVIYKGPFASVTDDEGHLFPRGERIAVCERTYRFLTSGPLQDHFIGIAPAHRREPQPWCAPPGTRRPVSETKGGQHRNTRGGGCC